MTIGQHADVFYQRRVKVFASPNDWEGPDVAYRLGLQWDDEQRNLHTRLDQFAAQSGIERLQALIIGAWIGDDSMYSSANIVKELVKHRAEFVGLKALFLGDITYEENEISWIEQSDVTPLLYAYPNLEVFRVRGGNNLKFSRTRHLALQQLIVEAGGLPKSVLHEIAACEFPSLQHLELWLGENNYGADGTVEDLQPFLAGKYFPRLLYLGLRNSDIADDIAAAIVNAPVLQLVQTLDLSNGTLSDIGGEALLHMPEVTSLKELNLTHHYLSDAMVERLHEKLKCEVIADDGQGPDAEWRSVVVSE